MPASLLVRAVDGPATSDLTALRRKGDVVVVRPLGWEWGAEEQLPNYIHAHITDTPFLTILRYAEKWERRLQLDFVSQDTALSQYTYRLYSDKVRSSDGTGQLILAELEAYLLDWSASIVSATLEDGITVDFDIANAAQSENFWGGLQSSLLFTPSYDEPSLTHTIDVDYNPYTGGRNNILMAVHNSLGRVAEHDTLAKTLTYKWDEPSLRDVARKTISGMVRRIVGRRRFKFKDASVDNVVNQGGEWTGTGAQAQTHIDDDLA